ncbi:MAG: hypothetical protein QWI36_00880 [Wolbachia endosymbiont of Tyrophagus putrescentiae]|nr:hypothetical protein [Wolbachia endosymbiont of Tyrophagus putrescentiae]
MTNTQQLLMNLRNNEDPYPNTFYKGTAIGNGSCFFDSFRQGLEQQKGIKVTVEQLREECREFVLHNPPQWFKDAIANSYDNMGRKRNEAIEQYTRNILNNNRWGDPEVEGRILCEKYGVKLHVMEKNPLHCNNNQQDKFLCQLVDNKGSKSVGVDKVNYNDNNTIHIINNGELHFEPLLNKERREREDFLLAKDLQAKEIFEYLESKGNGATEEQVQKIFNELLAENPNCNAVGECIKHFENANTPNNCVQDARSYNNRKRKLDDSPSTCTKRARIDHVFPSCENIVAVH